MVLALSVDHQALAAEHDKSHQDEGVKDDAQRSEVPQHFLIVDQKLSRADVQDILDACRRGRDLVVEAWEK